MKEPGNRYELDIPSTGGKYGTRLMVLGAWSFMAVPAHCHDASHGSRASATGETLVKAAYIDWIATLPIVPSVSPKFVPLA